LDISLLHFHILGDFGKRQAMNWRFRFREMAVSYDALTAEFTVNPDFGQAEVDGSDRQPIAIFRILSREAGLLS
jgi:hypothetical protein